MSIKFTGCRYLTPATPNTIWNNQAQASLSFFVRYELDGSAAISPTSTILARTSSTTPYVRLSGSGGTAFNLTFAFTGGSGTRTVTVALNTGTVYHIVLTYDGAGFQSYYVNGIRTNIASPLTGNLVSNSNYFCIGNQTSAASSTTIFSLENIAVWHGYVLTDADVTALRDATRTTDQIGAGAAARFWWPLTGTAGNAPAVGDAGLVNRILPGTSDVATITGSGSAVYGDALAAVPSVGINEAKVTTSGKALIIRTKNSFNNAVVYPTAVNTPPTLFINGVNKGQLVSAWTTGYHDGTIFSFPPGVAAQPGDAVTISGPANWVSSNFDLSAALDQKSVKNCTGISAYRGTGFKPSLKIGLNMPHNGTQTYTLYNPFKNWRRRITQGVFGSGSICTRDGFPIKLGTGGAATFTNSSISNIIDSTNFPDPVGYWAVGWDDLNPNAPTTLAIQASDPTNCTVIELTDRRNYGANGLGQVRVYQVSRPSNSTVANLGLQLQVAQAGNVPQFDPATLEIHGPGDFTLAPAGTPQTLDRSNPFAISETFKDRAGVTPAILRFMDSTAIGNTSLQSAMSDPEDMRPMNDFSWGTGTYRTTRTIGLSQIRPYDFAISPYVYSPYFGTPYTATLANPITTTPAPLTQEVVTITDAATAPVFAGQCLAADGEIMRVLSVSGTSVTVERGANGTTPVTHSAGTINVNYRLAVTDNTWMSSNTTHPYFEVVTSTPHGLKTGVTPSASVSGTYANQTLLTTRTTLTKLGGIGKTDTVLDVNSTSDCYVNIFIKFDNEDMKVTAVNAAANQITVARAQNGTTAATHAQGAVGTTHTSNVLLADGKLFGLGFFSGIWVTSPTSFVIQGYLSNSTATAAFPQNFDPASYYYTWTMPDNPGFPYGAAAQIVGQIPGCGYHVNIPPGATDALVWAIAREIRDNIPPGRRIIVEWANEAWNTGYAAYLFALVNSRLLFNSGQPYRYTARRHKECQDIFIAAFNEGGRGRGGEIVRLASSQYFGAAVTSTVLNQMAADGVAVDEVSVAPYFRTDNSANLIFDACDNEQAIDYFLFDLYYSWQADTTNNKFSFNSVAQLQWNSINSYKQTSGNQNVKLATYEGGIEAPLPSTCANYMTRVRDIVYNPNWYHAEQDIYAWMQGWGFDNLVIYAYSMNYNISGRPTWGVYHGDQDYGRGDGSDGKADNRLCLATPGFPTSKSATTSLEVKNVSVRGQAVRDWIQSLTAGITPQSPDPPNSGSVKYRLARRSSFGFSPYKR